MASTNNGNQTMAEQDQGADDADRDETTAGPRAVGGGPGASATALRGGPSGGGFFTIYKRGQGYWTRMGTAIGAALIAAVVVYELFQYLPLVRNDDGKQLLDRNAIVLVAIAFLAVVGLLVWWLMNKPTNADFLIATDSEMKKVNWTSRRELIGSTKVVVVFMFLIAAILFVLDTGFHYLFYWIDVLKFKPFG